MASGLTVFDLKMLFTGCLFLGGAAFEGFGICKDGFYIFIAVVICINSLPVLIRVVLFPSVR